MAQCEKCGREFKTDHALKIHMGRTHGTGKARKAKAARKAGKLACPECGRTFGLAMHLARHRSAAHGAGLRGKPGRKPGRRLGRKPGPKPGRKAAARSPLAQLTIDDLLTLRAQIDARLADIGRQMRQANIRF